MAGSMFARFVIGDFKIRDVKEAVIYIVGTSVYDSLFNVFLETAPFLPLMGAHLETDFSECMLNKYITFYNKATLEPANRNTYCYF